MPKDIDWTPIEADFRIGKMSAKAVALKHGVSYSGLRKKAGDMGWSQDLTPVVQAATRAELTKQAQQRAEKAAPPSPAKKRIKAKGLTDDEVVAASAGENVAVITGAIDAAVAENVAVINRHRKTADALMLLVGRLAEEVKVLTDNIDDPEKLRGTLGDRVDALRKLSQTVATVVEVERKAHNLDDKLGAEDGLAELVKSLQGSSLPIVQNDPEADEQ